MSSGASVALSSSGSMTPIGGGASTGQKVSTALRKVKGNIERLFEKNLADMIRGIRNNKENEAKYIAQCMEEIKQELKQDNIVLKANAVAKLTYLQMLGYDISWAAFNIIEVMSSHKFTYKRIGYLASSQSFNENTDVVMLTTNLIRKDLNSATMYEAGVALGGLACFVTHDLARDLANDVVTLLTSSKPYIRKRAVLLLYKVFLRYPDALRPTFPRLKEKLEDPDQGVQSAAVNVICELARKNPKNYLSLAPVFFKLMTTSTNNWMLIKIIKLFGALTPFEPRLGKKLIEPLTNLINSTSAMSLLYECINTVIAVLISISSEAPGNHTASIQLCVQKLSALIEDADQNLKYLGLLAMGRILQTHPKAVQVHKDLILACLDDKDESIRLRALDLLYGMVSKKNIMEIVKRLLQHVETAEGSAYRDELLAKIVQICSHNNYQHITNFEWYVSVLVELTKVEGTKHGSLIANQMLDVAVRVHSIRHFAVSQMALLIENAHLLLSGSAQHRSNICEVLYAAAWICGEYSEHVRNSQAVLESLLRTKINIMPGHIQSVFIQNIAKLYAGLVNDAEKEDDWDRVYSLDNLMLSKLPVFEQSDCLEAQERACTVMQLTKEIDKLHKNGEKLGDDLVILFDGELGPVAAKAQRKVPLPTDLDLEAWINEPPPVEIEESSESEPEPAAPPQRPGKLGVFANSTTDHGDEKKEQKRREPTEKELQQMREARKQEMEANPNYLKSSGSQQQMKKHRASDASSQLSRNTSIDGKLPEVVPIELQSPLEIPGIIGVNQYMEQQQKTMSWKNAKKEKKAGGKKKKSRRKDAAAKDDSTEEEEQVYVQDVNRGPGELPEGARSTDEDEPTTREDPYRALDINLDEPLRADERLPVLHHRVVSPQFETVTSPLGENATATTKEKEKRTSNKKKSVKSSMKEKEKSTKPEKEKEKKKKTKKEKTPTTEIASPPAKEETKNAVVDDIELWLADEKPTPVVVTETLTTPTENGPSKEIIASTKKTKSSKKEGGKSSKSGGSKREKREKRLSQCSASLVEALDGGCDSHLRVIDRADYEETSGLCTPSQQDILLNSNDSPSARPPSQSPVPQAPVTPELNNYRNLAENGHLKLTFETRVSSADSNHMAVNIFFTNLTDQQISKLEFTVLDSMNVQLMKGDLKPDQSYVVPFVLPPRMANEHEFRFVINAVNMPQKLRGNLTYMLKTGQGTHGGMLDFQLKFPCINFTVPATISKDSFADLLSSGELSTKNSVNFTCNDNFQNLLTKICFFGHLTIVELMSNDATSSASMYCQTIQSHPICLLVKQQDENVNIDGKCSDSQLLSHFLQEIRDIFVVSSS